MPAGTPAANVVIEPNIERAIKRQRFKSRPAPKGASRPFLTRRQHPQATPALSPIRIVRASPGTDQTPPGIFPRRGGVSCVSEPCLVRKGGRRGEAAPRPGRQEGEMSERPPFPWPWSCIRPTETRPPASAEMAGARAAGGCNIRDVCRPRAPQGPSRARSTPALHTLQSPSLL